MGRRGWKFELFEATTTQPLIQDESIRTPVKNFRWKQYSSNTNVQKYGTKNWQKAPDGKNIKKRCQEQRHHHRTNTSTRETNPHSCGTAFLEAQTVEADRRTVTESKSDTWNKGQTFFSFSSLVLIILIRDLTKQPSFINKRLTF